MNRSSGQASSVQGSCVNIFSRNITPAVIALVVWILMIPPNLMAGENDFVLSRLATFTDNPQCPEACGVVNQDTTAFRNLSRDTAQLFAPRFMNPADTLGQAGFSADLVTSLSFIPNNKSYWQTAVEDRNPSRTMTTIHGQLRKGLPFSFELAGEVSYLLSSDMYTLGTHLKWALFEGYENWPDVALRGTGQTLMGSQHMNLYTIGGDGSLSYNFAVSGVAELVPYTGYQQLHYFTSSRIISAYPQDPRPPQANDENTSIDDTFSPEFVFSNHHSSVNRFFLGLRTNIWAMSFALEGAFGQTVQQISFSGSLEF
jgi:hypothetical protein